MRRAGQLTTQRGNGQSGEERLGQTNEAGGRVVNVVECRNSELIFFKQALKILYFKCKFMSKA